MDRIFRIFRIGTEVGVFFDRIDRIFRIGAGVGVFFDRIFRIGGHLFWMPLVGEFFFFRA